MTANELLRDLTMRGVALSVDGDQLNVEALDDLLTDELLTTLRDHKAELLALLKARPAPEPEAVEEFTLTPPDAKPDTGPRLGSCDMPRVLLGTKMPKTCPYHTCGGELSWRGYTRGECTLAYCKTCDTWWGLQPDTPGVYVGDLADNDPLVEVDLHDRKPPRYVRQSVLSNWPAAPFNDKRRNHG
jgi:hypothetical protein